MNWRIFSTGLMLTSSLITSPLLLANGDENGIAHRVAALEQQVTTIMATLDRVSPVTDLTGKTYCIFGQGTWLVAGNGYAAVVANPFSTRVDFTSATEYIATDTYDPYSWIALPGYVMGDEDDASEPEHGTYTIVGNRLTGFSDEEDAIFYMTPDAQVLVGGFHERTSTGEQEWWETGIVVGVQAASCD